MGKQNGFIFYIPAWLTSKIDPATGFVNLLKTKYVSIAESRNFISSFDRIYFDVSQNMFVFELDYTKFARTDVDYKKRWTLYSNGNRIRVFRNPRKNNEFDYEVVELTKAFQMLFEEHGVDYTAENLIEVLIQQDEKQFYLSFMSIVSLMLQMRNSISGRVDVDYMISPVKDAKGNFYDSRMQENSDNAKLPQNADANGAYNIARKVLWAIEQFKESSFEEVDRTKIAISNKEWLQYAQTHTVES